MVTELNSIDKPKCHREVRKSRLELRALSPATHSTCHDRLFIVLAYIYTVI